MRRAIGVIGLLLTLLPVYLSGDASSTVEVLERHPAADEVLGVGQPLYLRLVYRSDVPLRFQLRSTGDAGLSALMNPAPLYPAGTGEALVWLAHRKPVYLDSATLLLFDENWQELQTIEVPLRARWGIDGTSGAEPGWVTQLRQEQQEQVRVAASVRDSGGDWLVTLMALSLPGYLILQVMVWRRWRGTWRRAGLLPIWVAVPLLAYTVALLIAGSNLWPVILLLIMPILFLYLVGLSIARGLTGGG